MNNYIFGFTKAIDGHFSSMDGIDMANRYVNKEREFLMCGDKTDMELAFEIAVCTRNELRLNALQEAAKDRIRWLSAKLARANIEIEALRATVNKLEKERDDEIQEQLHRSM